jgi:SH3 domain protein
MRKAISAVFLALLASTVAAQETGYITDKLYVPVRAGQGTEYRIVHRGIPSGTQLVIDETNEETGYSHITTAGGTEGWVLSRYIQADATAETQLEELREQNQALLGDEGSLRSQLVELQDSEAEMRATMEATQEELRTTRQELVEVRRVSSNALSLDTNNRRLTQEAEMLKTRIEILEADNERLKSSAESDSFINGALAVLLGVIITLLVPRLRPQRKSSSSWA